MPFPSKIALFKILKVLGSLHGSTVNLNFSIKKCLKIGSIKFRKSDIFLRTTRKKFIGIYINWNNSKSYLMKA